MIVSDFLLYDEFPTDRAAGAVNGTAAEPGPGVRAVTDANSKLSLSSGVASFATGGSAAGDPGLWYGAQSRAAGRLLIAQATPANTNGIVEIGWDTAQSGSINDAILLDASGVIKIRPDGGTAIELGTYTAIAQKTALLLRATGAILLWHNGTNWLLYWISSTGSGATVYPAIVAGNTTSVFTNDYIRAPDTLWLPTPLCSDGFGTAFGTTDGLGHAETSGVGSGGSGCTWTGSTWSVSGGKAINTPTPEANIIVNGSFAADTDWAKQAGWTISGGVGVGTATTGVIYQSSATDAIWYAVTWDLASLSGGTVAIRFGNVGGPDVSTPATGIVHTKRNVTSYIGVWGSSSFTGTIDNVSAVPLTLSTLFSSTSTSTANVLAGVDLVVSDGTQAGLVLNLDSTSSPANFLIAYRDGLFVNLEKCVAGAYTSLISVGAPYVANARLVVSTRTESGSLKVRLYYNNALIGTEQTVSDSGIKSNTKHGLFSTYASNTLDNYTCYATGTDGEYASDLRITHSTIGAAAGTSGQTGGARLAARVSGVSAGTSGQSGAIKAYLHASGLAQGLSDASGSVPANRVSAIGAAVGAGVAVIHNYTMSGIVSSR